jgi:hypothetical protein
MIEFPRLTPGFGTYSEEHGIDDSVNPTEARRLELAHFADEAASRKFEAEFLSYLMLGIIDGPSLPVTISALPATLPHHFSHHYLRSIICMHTLVISPELFLTLFSGCFNQIILQRSSLLYIR